MITFKKFVENQHLDFDAPFLFQLALKKELKASKEEANEVIEWLINERDWSDVSPSVKKALWNFVGSEYDRAHPGLSYEDFVMDEIHNSLLVKYDLNTRDLLMRSLRDLL